MRYRAFLRTPRRIGARDSTSSQYACHVAWPMTGTEAWQNVFLHERKPTRQYPRHQEVFLSRHRTCPGIPSMGICTGGSELDLVKALYQLNLLSKQTVAKQEGLTAEAMVRHVMPGMQKPIASTST